MRFFIFEREVLGLDIKEIHHVDEKEESEDNLKFSQ